jgi:1-acyl-sn-glycerol-3-phosphate acyltransferase
MIPARKNIFISNMFAKYVRYRMHKAFRRICVTPIELRPDHSILLLSNHFSWWDGFFLNYIEHWVVKRPSYLMMQHDHLEKRMFFNLVGCFSIERGTRQMLQSLMYAADLLNDPRKMVAVFPQGSLQSNHISEISVEKGIARLIKHIKGPCQIVYSCTLIEYFESLKPSAYVQLFDCGVAGEVPFDELVTRINGFHQQALKNQVDARH